ncbi:MAG: hypothetical protein A6F72_07555 [Cycloclasticus sp. symbiont of Poecilosclerida sp. N]|nr:MAG: hypothetical protein A6F72_07555 [Cycloclasticus sp. symbiont of Poecilosclerida sp. N]
MYLVNIYTQEHQFTNRTIPLTRTVKSPALLHAAFNLLKAHILSLEKQDVTALGLHSLRPVNSKDKMLVCEAK